MSVRLNASGDDLRRTADLPPTSGWTACGWAVSDVDKGAFACLVALEDVAGSKWQILETLSDGDTLVLVDSGTGSNPTLAVIDVGVPFFWCLTVSSVMTGYYRLVTENVLTTQTLARTTFTPNRLTLGNDSFSEYWNGRLWNVKVWDRALSADEILVESFYAAVKFPASLNFHWLLRDLTDTGDFSGNDRSATVNGTLTTGDERALWRPRVQVPQLDVPTILVQPTDQVAAAGASATFSLVATGASSYQWQVSADGSSFSDVTTGTGGTTDTYVTATLARAQAGYWYRCILTNSNGSKTSSRAMLTVTGIPTSYAGATGLVVGSFT